MASEAVSFVFSVCDIEKRYFHAMLDTEIVKDKSSYKKQHEHPENGSFSEEFVDEYDKD